jgi:hypothetical protein
MNDVFQISHAARGGMLQLPAVEVVLLLIVLAICLLVRFTRTGLVVAYLFVYRWCWLFYHETLFRKDGRAMAAFLAFGVIVLVCTVIGMIHSPSDD